MNDFITWELIATFAGAAASVTVLTEIIKRFLAVDPKWIALALSLVVSFGVQIHSGDFAAMSFILSGINAIAIAGASIGAYESAGKTIEKLLGGKTDGK